MWKFIKSLDIWKTPEYITIYQGKCKAWLGSTFVTPFQVDAKTFIKVSTNLKNNHFKCYMSDGVHKKDIDIEVMVTELPHLKPLLESYGIRI